MTETGGKSYPEFVPDACTPTQFENYTVYPILCDSECYGYVYRVAEVVMIVRYLAAACSD